jgi:hypothetical protein
METLYLVFIIGIGLGVILCRVAKACGDGFGVVFFGILGLVTISVGVLTGIYMFCVSVAKVWPLN